MLIPVAVKESIVNGDDHDGNTTKVDRMTGRSRTVTTSVTGKCNDEQQISAITTTTTTTIVSSTVNVMDENEMFLPKVYDDITQPTPSITALNKSDGKFSFLFFEK